MCKCADVQIPQSDLPKESAHSHISNPHINSHFLRAFCFLRYVKIPGNIKTEIDVTIAPAAGGLCYILCFDQALRVTEY